MKYLGRRDFAGLVHKGRALPRPNRPWIIDTSVLQPFDGIVPGNIANFGNDPDWAQWILSDTPADPSNILSWQGFRIGERECWICDRVILMYVSWSDLDARGFVEGAPVTIDDTHYVCRLLSGGSDFRNGDDGFSGSVLPNEWDAIVATTSIIDDQLPVAEWATENRPLCSSDLGAPHNRCWNWLGAHSWTRTPFVRDATKRVCRGYRGPQFFYLNTHDHRHEDIGWRPVLERVGDA